MCGRFALDEHVNTLIADFVAAGGDYGEWVPTFSIAPTNRVPIVRERVGDDQNIIRTLESAMWGLRPGWAKPGGPAPINARMETLATNGMFRGAFAAQRCLVPMSGYFEWTEEKDGKQPHYIHGDGILAAAGLYAARKEDDVWKLTFTIATREAADAGGQVHDRMPVFLQRATWADWLNPSKAESVGTTESGATDSGALVAMMEESSLAVAATLQTHLVDRKLNNTRTVDRFDPTIIEPLAS